MTSLRAKLVVGLGGLLLSLVAMGLLAGAILHRYSEATQSILRDDLGSVEAAHAMALAVRSIDAALHDDVRGESKDAPAVLARESARFDAALKLQFQQVTLPGEQKVTDDLTLLWRQYQGAARALLADQSAPEQRLSTYRAQLAPLASRVQAAAEEIYRINDEAILPEHGKANDAARTAQLAMLVLALGGAALGLLFTLVVARGILRPVQALTRTVQDIERGNLDLTVPVHTRDELGRLAQAVNAMAAQLRELRRIDHERLIRTQRTTQLAIDSLPDAVVVINPEGCIEIGNELAARLLGLRPGVRVDAQPHKWLADLHQRVWRDHEASGTGGLGGAIEVADGDQQRFYLPKAMPILGEDRRFFGSTIVLADVTDLRRLDDMKNGLLAMVSHELKTPLTSLGMILPLFLEGRAGPLTGAQRDLLAAARDDCNRLHQIVENLLDMARIEAGKALMEPRPVYADQIVRRAVEPLAPMFADHGVTLHMDLPPQAQVVMVDATRVGYVLANLLVNALRYTPRGGHVRITLRAEPEGVEFIVSDNGSGIPKQYLHRVFEKFFRVPGQSGAAGSGGSGLGLAIAQDIVKAHGGQITVESDEGRGATFRFTLPHGGRVAGDLPMAAPSSGPVTMPKPAPPTPRLTRVVEVLPDETI